MNRRHHLKQLAALAGLGMAPPLYAQSLVMKLSTTASGDLDVDWLEAYKKHIEAATAGKVKGQVYPASQLGTAQRTIEGVSMGTIELTLNASGLYEGLDARFGALAVPGVFDSIDHGIKVLGDAEVRKQFSSIAAKKGVEFFTVLVHSQCSVVTRKPVRKLSDFQGLKIRVPGSALLIVQLKQLGANPVSMSLGEVLPAFQNGTLDGVYAGTPIPSALKYYDVAKSQTLLPSTFISIVGLVSNTFLKSTGALEPALREAARKTDAEIAPRARTRIDEARSIWEKGGGEMIRLPAADEKSYLDATVPAASKELTPEGRQDYELLRRVAGKYH
jgi:TRAP-type C4-dicarboxylate transport system substrate-binding protein